MSSPLPHAFRSIDAASEALGAHGYIAERELATSVFLALRLQRPLLLEGEAGVGKTELGRVLAAALDAPLIRLQCYEGLDASQALYDWDYARQMLGEIHQQFIATVKKGRGGRLKDQPELFSGLMWTGEKSIELGLADAIGSVDFVAREVIKAEEIVNFSRRESLLERLVRRLGVAMGEALVRAASPGAIR